MSLKHKQILDAQMMLKMMVPLAVKVPIMSGVLPGVDLAS
jgi:hypothetical protein